MSYVGIKAVETGIPVYFTNSETPIERLKLVNRDGTLESKLKG